MDVVVNPVLVLCNTAMDYVRDNAWHMALLVVAGWFLKTTCTLSSAVNRVAAGV